MPIQSDPPTEADRFDPDQVHPPIVTIGLAINEVRKIEIDFHSHRKGQFLLVQKGALSLPRHPPAALRRVASGGAGGL